MRKDALSDRAWQFMPFSALRGYEEFLHEQEDQTEHFTSEIRIPEPCELADECEQADVCDAIDECETIDLREETSFL